MILRSLDRYRDFGLLILRVGIGFMYMGHGVPKLLGGPELWGKVGGAMGRLGVTFAPEFWGLMAGCAESLGGLFLALGFFFRPATGLVAFTMFVASVQMMSVVKDFATYSRPIEMFILMASLFLIGPGRFSLDDGLGRRGQARGRARANGRPRPGSLGYSGRASV